VIVLVVHSTPYTLFVFVFSGFVITKLIVICIYKLVSIVTKGILLMILLMMLWLIGKYLYPQIKQVFNCCFCVNINVNVNVGVFGK
jgi:hypothetical protein